MSNRVGLLLTKVGMTSIFLNSGRDIAVTLLKLGVNKTVRVSENSVDIAFSDIGSKHVNKPQKAILLAADAKDSGIIKGFHGQFSGIEVGKEFSIGHFSIGQYIDVSGISLGCGFSGVMRRHNFAGLRASHGVSLSHRSPGSTGQRQDPGKVFKGKKMPGRYGGKRITIQNLKVIALDVDRGLLVVKGAVPGYKGSTILVRDAIKKRVGV